MIASNIGGLRTVSFPIFTLRHLKVIVSCVGVVANVTTSDYTVQSKEVQNDRCQEVHTSASQRACSFQQWWRDTYTRTASKTCLTINAG